MIRKIIAYFCSFAIIFSFFAVFSVSASAGSGSVYTATTFWDWLRANDSGLLNAWSITHSADDSGCNASHDGNHSWKLQLGVVGLDTPSRYVCEYCGESYSDYAQSAYEDALSSNNLTGIGYNNSGQLIFYPDLYLYQNGYTKVLSVSQNALIYSLTVTISGILYECVCNGASNYGSYRDVYVFLPYAGTYTDKLNISLSGKSNNPYIKSFSRSGNLYSTAPSYRNTFTFYHNYGGYTSGSDLLSISGYYLFTPASGSSAPPVQIFYTAINNINSTSINLATVDNSQNITNVYENTTVINNNNTTFTIPGGSSYPIDSWSFDFDNNRYTLVVLDGELEIPVTVRFGVDDLNIDFGGDTYNYKYVTEAAPHVHTWELTSSTDPTCTSSGSKTYTCSGCNDVRTETVPALGHDWQLVSSVEDHYEADLAACACGDCGSTNVSLASGGENYFTSEEIGVVCDDCGSSWTILGSFVPGYEVYQCSRCQEEKTVSFGDPVDNSASGFWAWLRIWLENFKTWLGEKLDELLGRENNIIFEPLISPDIQITIPTPDIGFQYADEEGEPDVWHPSDLKEKFAFWADVKDIGAGLYASVQAGGEAPELIIHLGEANSPYGFHYGGDEYALDLSWYGPYKPTVDSITGGFLWLLYLYGVFKNLPNILSGVGMVDNRVQDIQSGTKGGRRRD